MKPNANYCSICKAYHGLPPLEHLKPGCPCPFDPERLCRLCGNAVKALSMAGPDICPACDCGIGKTEKKSLGESLIQGLEQFRNALREGRSLRKSTVRVIRLADGRRIVSRVADSGEKSSE